MPLKQTVGFLGAGKMATALAQGMVRAGLVKPRQIVAGDVSPAARKAFAREVGAKTVASNEEVFKRATVIILAVKPHQVETVIKGVKDVVSRKHLVISIVAGLTSCGIAQGGIFGSKTPYRCVRVMPNTPALVGAGAAAFCRGPNATASDAKLTAQILGAVGVAVEVPEAQMDAVTGLSGSGPAYGFQIIEALSDGGVAAGLPRDLATRLAAQTMLGAARMVLDTGMHPGALKDMVTSPGGTTIAGLRELEVAGVRGALMEAVGVAAARSREMTQ